MATAELVRRALVGAGFNTENELAQRVEVRQRGDAVLVTVQADLPRRLRRAVGDNIVDVLAYQRGYELERLTLLRYRVTGDPKPKPGIRRQAQVPRVAAAYFGTGPNPPISEFPIITQAFIPGKGWKRYPFKKRISRAWARKMLAEGVTQVGLSLPGSDRVADFRVRELL